MAWNRVLLKTYSTCIIQEDQQTLQTETVDKNKIKVIHFFFIIFFIIGIGIGLSICKKLSGFLGPLEKIEVKS